MALIDYELDEHVAVLTMNSADNRFNTPFLEAFQRALDEIEEKTEVTALVTTSSHEKVWSNGIDLDWLGSTAEQCAAHHVVKEACHIDELMDEALAFARTLNKNRERIRSMKAETHQDIVAVIDESIATPSQPNA